MTAPTETDPTITAVDAGGDDARFDGDQVGRYLLLRELGRGAMGRVFAGFDPDLQRSVAIKLVQDGKGDLDPYLLREGRVLAQLSHPNIVPVFDIGRDGERIYVVMELVEGVSLADWLDAKPRSPREIIRAWCEAGRGLAAAHVAGVVHRDFKGNNVLFGNDGRIRVADFGLARSPDPDDGATARPYEGTRPYLAPEVLESGAITTAVDQYAFCTSLQRALPEVPRRVRSILARGLAADPSARWPSMSPLVDALERSQRVPRAVFVAGGIAAIAGAVIASRALTAESGCETPQAVIARVLGTSKVDVEAWSTRYAAACTNPPLARCLEMRLDDLAGVLEDAAIDPSDKGVVLAQWNAEVEACDAGGDDDARESREYRHAMARTRLMSGSWQPEAAMAAADEAIAKAREPAAKIRARVIRIMVTPGPDLAAYEPIYADALATRDRELPGDVAIAAAEACIEHEAPCAQTWIARVVERLQRAPSVENELKLLGLRGDQAVREGNEAVANALYAEEVRRATTFYGELSWAVFPGLIKLAGTLHNLGRFAESLEMAQRADAVVVRWVGEDHPFRTQSLWAIGNARLGLGDRAGARADFERTIAIEGARAGTDERPVAALLSNLSGTYEDDGDLARALEIADRAIAIHDHSKLPDDGSHVTLVRNAAVLAGTLGQDARPRIERAFALAATNMSPNDVFWPMLYASRANIRIRAGALDDAANDLREALARLSKISGRDVSIANAESRLAGIALRKRAFADARGALDRAKQHDPDGAVYLLHEVEYARAVKRDPKPALDRLVPMFENTTVSDPRLTAHVFALAGDRARAVAVLRTAGVRETALDEDCITCQRIGAAEPSRRIVK